MAKDTKERILEAALDIFARDGFAGTNIKDIADAVGIVKSALYRHFESKEAIWNGLTESMTAYYHEHFGNPTHRPETPNSTEALKTMTMNMLRFTIYDARIVKVRKILTLEQYRDEKIRGLATRHFLTDIVDMFTGIFERMMGNGCLRADDPAALAFEYAAPISLLVQYHDREPARDAEIMDMIERHIDRFIKLYGI